MNNGILLVIIGLIVVGGIGVFSIYLQSDKAIAEIKNVVEPNYHCLADYDDLYSQIKADPAAKFIEENKEKFSKLLHDRCFDTFREWMPESHSGWDQMIVRENNGINTCKRYFAGEITFTEANYEYYDPIQRCEKLLKK